MRDADFAPMRQMTITLTGDERADKVRPSAVHSLGSLPCQQQHARSHRPGC